MDLGSLHPFIYSSLQCGHTDNLPLLLHTACFLAGVEAELRFLGSGNPGSGLDNSGYVSSEHIFMKEHLGVD